MSPRFAFGLVALVAAVAARSAHAQDASAPTARTAALCVVVEPRPDGAVFVSEPLAPPLTDWAAELAPDVYLDAFEQHVRQRYSYEASRPLLAIGCFTGTEAELALVRRRAVRREGNTAQGKLIRTEVPWTPEARLVERSREQRRREAEELARHRAAGFRGYIFCLHRKGTDEGPLPATLSAPIAVPVTGDRREFARFAALLFERERGGKQADVLTSCGNYATTLAGIERQRQLVRRVLELPDGGGTIGEPDQRDVFPYRVEQSTWKLDDRAYQSWAEEMVAQEALARQKAQALESASNARRRRDCIAGKASSCGPAPRR